MKYAPLLHIGLLTASVLISACSPEKESAPPRRVADSRQIDTLLENYGLQELVRSPEMSSRLGLSPEKLGYTFGSLLDDRSQANFERTRLERLETYEILQKLNPQGLPEDTRTNLEVTVASLGSVIDIQAFGHGQVALGFSRPFAADQLSGAYIDLPDLLINRHIIRDKTDALAYLRRISLVADSINDDTRRLIAEASAGIVPPDFILARMIALSQELRNSPGGRHPLVTAFEKESLSATGLSQEERSKIQSTIARFVQEDIIPAYKTFEESLLVMSQKAPSSPGIWSIPKGSNYYQASLKFYTGQETSASDLHDQGLVLVTSLQADLDLALQEAGFPEGPLNERLAALNALPEQLYENSLEGREALLQSLRDRIQKIQPKMSLLIPSPPHIGLKIEQIPDFLSINAPGGYYSAAPADGTSPGTFYINLRDTSEWPAYTLPTLFYHEAIPGHHFESAVIAEQGNLPIVRQLIWLPAYGEGWALYAEDLANDLGVYDDDPYGKVGYIQSLLFRAARLVTDTGLHHKRWSRGQAIAYLVETTGQSKSAMETEVDRYTVWPGQSVSYMVGRQFIWKLRQRSQTALGKDFNLAAFHQVILSKGPRPLRLVEADIEAWISQQRP